MSQGSSIREIVYSFTSGNATGSVSTHTSRRLVGLDVLRAAAVLLVLFHHSPVASGPLSVGGWVGVDLFFVLSGFLVSGLLFHEHRSTGEVRPFRFLVRRGFKIYPVFWLMLIASAAWAAFRTDDAFVGRHAKQWFAELLFLQNYTPGYWAHTWSLAVEEHFYFGLAALMFWLFRMKAINHVPSVFAAIAVVCLGLRYIASASTDFYQFLTPTHLRIDSLFFGVLLAWWHRGRAVKPLVALGALLFIPAFVFPVEEHRWMRWLGPVLFYMAAGSLVLTVGQWRTRHKVARMVAAVGAASYSIYLWHLLVLDILVWQQPQLGSLLPWAFFVGSIAVGLASMRFLETPFLLLREQICPQDNRPFHPPSCSKSPIPLSAEPGSLGPI